MKYVRHQPGYTPERAAMRRTIREIARRLGIPPRKLKQNYCLPVYSQAREVVRLQRTYDRPRVREMFVQRMRERIDEHILRSAYNPEPPPRPCQLGAVDLGNVT